MQTLVRTLSTAARRFGFFLNLQNVFVHGVPGLYPLLAILLLAAAFGKTATRGEPQIGQPLPGIVLDTLILYELFLALLLLSGRFRQITSRLALITFACFAAWSVRQLFWGIDSCGCLGSLHIPPSVMLALDVIVVFALLVEVSLTDTEITSPPQRA